MHGNAAAYGVTNFVDKFVDSSIGEKHKNLEKETTISSSKRKFNHYTLSPTIWQKNDLVEVTLKKTFPGLGSTH